MQVARSMPAFDMIHSLCNGISNEWCGNILNRLEDMVWWSTQPRLCGLHTMLRGTMQTSRAEPCAAAQRRDNEDGVVLPFQSVGCVVGLQLLQERWQCMGWLWMWVPVEQTYE